MYYILLFCAAVFVGFVVYRRFQRGAYYGKMMNVIGDVKNAGTKGMASPRQADAMGTLARIFRTA